MDYNDAEILTDYVWSYCCGEMTEFERVIWNATHAREKAAQSEDSRLAAMILERYGRENHTAVTAALADGVEEFRKAVRDRIVRDHPEIIKRCPKCNRVARTPTAKQCRWCFHTWHTTE